MNWGAYSKRTLTKHVNVQKAFLLGKKFRPFLRKSKKFNNLPTCPQKTGIHFLKIYSVTSSLIISAKAKYF